MLASVVTFSRAMRISFPSILLFMVALTSNSSLFAQEPALGFANYRYSASLFPIQPATSWSDSVSIQKRLEFQPLANLNAGYGDRLISVSWLGAQLQWNPAKRWSLRAGYALTGGLMPSYLERRAVNEGYLSGWGYAVSDTLNHLYHAHYSFGQLKYSAGKHVISRWARPSISGAMGTVP